MEDNEDDVLLIQRALKKANVVNPIQALRDGEKAISYLAGQGDYVDRQQYPLPFLILLDLKLPRRTGLEVLAWLRDQPGIRRTPVVILTSSQEEADIKRVYDLGANSYLVKPVAFEGLLDLARMLNLYWVLTNKCSMPENM